MDKLRLLLTSHREDISRLYDWSTGFRDQKASIAFPGAEKLTIFLISIRQYQLRVDGDATIKLDATYAQSFMLFYKVEWSAEAKLRGAGSATVTMVNPDAPDQPFIFNLTLGDFSIQVETSAEPVAPIQGEPTPPASQLGIEMMMMHEAAHAFRFVS